MRAVVLVLAVLAGCWHPTAGSEGSAASRGGGELVLPAELGQAVRLRRLIELKPVIGRIDRGATPIVIRGDVPVADIAELVATAHLIHADVTRRFVGRPDWRHPAVDLVLFQDDDEYQALALGYARVPAGQGFYRPDARVAAVNLARGRGNLHHELVHPLLVDDFPQVPPWLNEGLASMYGAAEIRRGRLQFGTDPRLYDLQGVIARHALPGRARFARAGRDELYGPDGGLYYAVSHYVVLYLQRTGQLERYYRIVRADPSRRATALARAVDWARFVRWARHLRAGDRVPVP